LVEGVTLINSNVEFVRNEVQTGHCGTIFRFKERIRISISCVAVTFSNKAPILPLNSEGEV